MPQPCRVLVLEETLRQEAGSACDVVAAPRALWEQREAHDLALGREDPVPKRCLTQSVESSYSPGRRNRTSGKQGSTHMPPSFIHSFRTYCPRASVCQPLCWESAGRTSCHQRNHLLRLPWAESSLPLLPPTPENRHISHCTSLPPSPSPEIIDDLSASLRSSAITTLMQSK